MPDRTGLSGVELDATWVSNEAPSVGLARDGVPLALTGPHGNSVDWLAG